MMILPKNKKAQYSFFENWPEYLAFALLIVGFIVAWWSGSAFLNYLIMFMSGILFGRMWWQKQDEMKFPLFLITTGYIIGFLLGSFYGNKSVIFGSFVIGFILSQQLHKNKVIDW